MVKTSKLLKGGSSLPTKTKQTTKATPAKATTTKATTTKAAPAKAQTQAKQTQKKTLNNKYIHPICYNKYTGENSFEKIFNKRKNEPNTIMLFIYNEDFTEYSNEDLTKGGGNGAYRPNRKDLSDDKLGKTGTNGYIDNMHTLGIPMGSHHDIDKGEIINSNPYKLVNNFTKIDILKNKNLIKKNEFLELSMQNIYSYVLKNNITDIYYSSGSCDKYFNIIKNDDYNMGLDIFAKYQWTQENKPKLNVQFKNLIDSLKKEGYNISNDNGKYEKPVKPVTQPVKPITPPVKPVTPQVPAPIVAPVTNKSFTNIGWDFDGVLHLKVTPLVSNNDSRHPYDNTFKGNGHTVQNHKLFDELFQKVIIPLNTFNQCIITTNKHLDVIKKYKYKENNFDNIFKYDIIKSSNKINDLQTKKINYFFDDSNSNIINIYKLWCNGDLSNLQKLYKVIPESIYDIYDHINNPSNANGTLNPPIVEILKTNENIKILTYNIKYDLNDESAVNVHAILKKTIEVYKVDFICLQEFGYVDTKLYEINGIQQKFKDTHNKDHNSVTFDDNQSNNNPFNKLNIKTKSIIDNKNYSYVYNIQNPEMQFTFYDKNKYTIKKDKDNKKDLIIRGRTDFNARPFTLIVFINISSNENLILINVHLPHKKNKKNNIMNNDFINRRIINNINKNKSINATILNYLKKSRVIVAGDFNRTIYSDNQNSNYYSNNSEYGSIKDYRDNIKLSNHKIDNSAYGLKLFGPSSIDKNILDDKNTNKSLNSLINNKNNSNDDFKSLIMYNIPINNTTFKKTTCSNLGHIDNVLDSFGLQITYDYDDTKNASDHIPVLVTLLAAKPVYDLSELQKELSPNILSAPAPAIVAPAPAIVASAVPIVIPAPAIVTPAPAIVTHVPAIVTPTTASVTPSTLQVNISDEELQKLLKNFKTILDKNPITECSEIKLGLTGRPKFSQKIYEELDINYLKKKIKLIQIKYFSNKTVDELYNFYDFINYIITNKFYIKYNNKCYDIDRWKLFFDSKEIIKNFIETKINGIEFIDFINKLYDNKIKIIEDTNEIKFLQYINPIYIELKKKFSSIIPDEFINYKDKDKNKPILHEFLNIGWNYDGVINLNVTPMLNNKEIRKNDINDILNMNILDNFVKKFLYNDKIHNHIITSNKNIENIKKMIFNKKLFSDIFFSIVTNEDKIIELKNKNIKYYFDDSNKNIIEIRQSKIDGNLPELKKLYKVYPESLYDIFDFKNDPKKAIGSYNLPVIEIKLDTSNIKILTYYVDYIDDKNIDSIKVKNIRKIIKKYMEEDQPDFICLQNFSYFDKINNDILYNNIKYDKNNRIINLRNHLNHPLAKLNSIDNIVNDKITKDTLEKYDYVYNKNQFTFFNYEKFRITITKFNKNKNEYTILRYKITDKIKDKKIEYPFTIILFEYAINKNINIILINADLPYSKSNNEINNFINKEFSKTINNDDKIKYELIIKKKQITKDEIESKNKIMNSMILIKIEETIKTMLINYTRVIMAGNFERTIYSNKKTDTYYSNKNKGGIEIDNSAYGLKLFNELEDYKNGIKTKINKSVILYNIPDNDKIFDKNTCCFNKGKISNPKFNYGHIDNVLDSFGLQCKYEYYETEITCKHLPVFVTLLDANSVSPTLKDDISEELKTLKNDNKPILSQLTAPVTAPIVTPEPKKRVSFTNKKNNKIPVPATLPTVPATLPTVPVTLPTVPVTVQPVLINTSYCY